MRRRWDRTRTAFTLGMLATLALPLAASAQGGTCSDCCKLPCIEARIWQARYMRGVYKRLVSTRKLTQEQYEARENDAKITSGFLSGYYLGANPACAWATPDPKDTTSWRQQFRDTGFSVREEGGVETWDFTVKVDPGSCSITSPRAAAVLPTVTPCEGIGRATIVHEQKHVDDCKAWKKRGGGALTPAQNAKREVAGYDAEIAELEKVRREAAEPCMKGSCKTSQLRFDIAARNFGTDIRTLLGLNETKPPSKSPLARGRKGV